MPVRSDDARSEPVVMVIRRREFTARQRVLRLASFHVIRLPYLRIEDTHARFEFLGWLSTLADSDGFIGTLHTAGPNSAPTLLFAYGGALHWGDYQGRPVPYRTDTTHAAPFLGP